MATTPQDDALAVANQRLSALQDQFTQKSAELETAKAEATGAKGDADKARGELEDAKKQIEQLKQANQALSGQVAQTGLPPIPDLPKGASQVVIPVTCYSGPNGIDGKPRRLTIKGGEVALVGTEKQMTALQEKLGSAIRVHLIDQACETELRSMNALR